MVGQLLIYSIGIDVCDPVVFPMWPDMELGHAHVGALGRKLEVG
jgi:hypothetical protein